MDAFGSRQNLVKSAGILAVGVLVGAVVARLTDVPVAAVFAVTFVVFAIEKRLAK